MNLIKSNFTIIGGGIFGLYTSLCLLKKGYTVTLIESDNTLFSRASTINQARLHGGYHYPRSINTIKNTSKNFPLFYNKFKFSINKSFKSYYIVAKNNSKTKGFDFLNIFLSNQIKIEEVAAPDFIINENCDSVYLTEEYSFDANKIKKFLINEIDKFSKSFNLLLNSKMISWEENAEVDINLSDGRLIKTEKVINCTYSNINSVLDFFDDELLNLNYELCEIVNCKIPKLKNTAITVVDGNYFSIFPYAQSGKHTLSSVKHTPTKKCNELKASFSCQENISDCNVNNLSNCNKCPSKPDTNYSKMLGEVYQFVKPDNQIEYISSSFAVKVKLNDSFDNDARPTLIIESKKHDFLSSIFSGKISAIFDVESYINELY